MIARPTWASRRREGALRDLEDELPVVLAGLEARERRLGLGQRPYRIEDRLPRRPLEHSQQVLESRGLPSCVFSTGSATSSA